MTVEEQIAHDLLNMKKLCKAIITVAKKCNKVADALDDAPISGKEVVYAKKVMMGVLKSFVPLEEIVNNKIMALDLQAQECIKNKMDDEMLQIWFDKIMKDLNK